MLPFETLLLKQLQKQQNRDEFCDIVLQSQGVSVPVHSCVLSAFSPRLYGTLSSMPVPMTGQRRLIELQAVDACTLLSLVNLLYSGQLHENREQVLSAAQTLGIEVRQWQEEERHGGKVGRRKDPDQETEKEVDSREWDDRMTRRMEDGSGEEKEKIRESSTQTEYGRETDERSAQTALACSEHQSIQTVCLIDQSTCSTNQGLYGYMDIHDPALALQVVYPELTTCDLLAKAPETGDCHTVSESACVSQIYLHSLETSLHQPSTSVTPHPHNSFLDQSVVVPAAGADPINDLTRFEGNIPGFMSYFLGSTNSQNIERRGQGCAREEAKDKQVVKRARSTGGVSVREWPKCIGRGRMRQRLIERWGLVARLIWRGQGGGRVGRTLETRSKGKNPMRAFQRRKVRKALVEAGEARGRGKQRHRVKTGTIAGSEVQNYPLRSRRPRGCPHLCPLLPASRSFSSMTPTELGTVDTTELDLLHMVTPTPAAQMEPVQPIDTLLDDLMTGLHFLPTEDNQTNQHNLMSSTTSSDQPILTAMYPNSHSVKPTDPKLHLEGELGDILDHFLRTFEQQFGCCGLDLGDETLTNQSSDESYPSTDAWNKTPKTCTQLQPHNPHLHHQKPQVNFLHTSRTLSTQLQFTSTVNPSVAENTNGQDGQIHVAEVQKPTTDQNIVQQFENRRLTRNQKRKLEAALISLQTPVKTKGIEKQSSGTMKKRQRDDLGQFEACVNKSGVNNLDKNKNYRATQAHSKERQASAREGRQEVDRLGRKKRSVENRSHRMDGVNERKKSPQKDRPTINGGGKRKNNVGEDHEEAKHVSNVFQICNSSVTGQIGGTCIDRASSAMEKVRKLLQLQGEEVDESANESVGICEENNAGNGRLVNHKERVPVENSLQSHLGKIQKPADEGRIADNGDGHASRSSVEETSQRHEEKERMADGLRPFRLNLPSNAVFSQGTMHKMADLTLDIGYAPGLTSTARLSHTQPCEELLDPHTSTKDLVQLAGSSVDEDEDVDVLEVSSLNFELPAVSTVTLGVDLGTEEEEDVEDYVEIDVLGLEPD